jgi:hypothetical protein
MFKYAVILGTIVQSAGLYYYIRDAIKGSVKPNKVTWLLWSVAPLIATFAELSSGVRWAVLPVFIVGFGPLLVFIISFFSKKSYWKINKFDYICGLFSILALVLWGVTKDPFVAIIFSILSDFFAGIITVQKTWVHPETEIHTPYSTGLFNCLTGFLAITAWNPSQYLFLTYLVLMNGSILFAMYRKRIKKFFNA